MANIKIYHTKIQKQKLLKEKGDFIVEKVKENCWNLSKEYFIDSDDVILYVTDVDKEIIGLACMDLHKDNRYYLSTVCIFKEYRGKGYGSSFVSNIVTNKRYYNYVIYLEVDRTNIVAIKSYIKAGFVYKRKYDKTYDIYEYKRTKMLNLMVYSMACNDPGLPDETGAVSLELGVMADIGKIITSSLNSNSANWLVTIYVDIYPNNYILEIRKDKNTNKVDINKKNVNKKDICKDRLKQFLKAYYNKDEINAFIIGGHGMIYSNYREAEFVPISYRKNGDIDRIKMTEILSCIPNKLAFLVLDSCCIGTLDNIYIFRNITDYIVCYQAEGPWNGFISTDTLSFCSYEDVEFCLKKSLDKYKEQSESQDDPSPITLIETKYIQQLYDFCQELPENNTKKGYRDLLNYSSDVLTKKEFIKLNKLYKKVVIGYIIPNNYNLKTENGLNIYI